MIRKPETAWQGLAYAPLDSEGARAFLQRRVSLMGKVVFGFSLVVQAVVTFVHFAARGSEIASGSGVSAIAHLAVVVIMAGIWLRTRSGRRSSSDSVSVSAATP